MTNNTMPSQDLTKHMQKEKLHRRATQLKRFSLIMDLCALGACAALITSLDNESTSKTLAGAAVVFTMSRLAAEVKHDHIVKKLYDAEQTR